MSRSNSAAHGRPPRSGSSDHAMGDSSGLEDDVADLRVRT